MIVPIQHVSVEKNIRQVKRNKAFDNLCNDIKQDGLLTPITVWKKNKTDYIIIAGHRRYAACEEVGLKDIDIKVITPKPTDEQITRMQINENVLRTDLSLFEEVMAFKSMADTSSTVQEICDKFGHSPKYVQQRLHLGNLVPELLQPEYVTHDNRQDLRKFANSHPKVQLEAIDHCRTNMCLKKSGEVEQHAPVSKRQGKVMTRKQYLNFYFDDNWLRNPVDFMRYPKLSYMTVPKETLIDVCGSEEKLREHEKEYGYKALKTTNLFAEFIETDYCTDSDFQIFLIKKCYPSVVEQLNDCPVKSIEKYDTGCISGHWYDMFQRDYIGQKDFIKNKVSGWNGDILYPVIKEKKQGTTSTGEKGSRPRYYGMTKKFGKIVVPLYVSYLRSNAKNILNNKSLEWCLKYSEINLKNLDHWDKGFRFQNMISKLTKKDRYDTNMFTGVFLGAYILESLYQSQIKHLSKLAVANELITIKDWFQKEWNTADNTQFRIDILSCFSAKLLGEYVVGKFIWKKGTKSDLVEIIASVKGDGKVRPFKFNDVFKTTEETDWAGYSSVFYFNSSYLDYYKLKK